MRKRTVVYVDVSVALKSRLKKLCAAAGHTESWVVRDALEQYVEKWVETVEALKAGVTR